MQTGVYTVQFVLWNLPVLIFSLFYIRVISQGWIVYTTVLLGSYGYFRITESAGQQQNGSWIVYLAPSLFLLGCITHNFFQFQNRKLQIEISELKDSDSWTFIVIMVSILSIYHYLKVGLIIFSANIETARFTSISNSGLFGIPGRSVLFCLPLLSILGVIHYENLNKNSTKFLISIYFFSKLASGFKSGIYEFTFVLALAYLIKKGGSAQARKRIKKRNLIALGTIILAQAAWTSSRYLSNRSRGLESFSLSYVLDRLTIQSALPQWIALSNNAISIGLNPFLTDFKYFMQKYLHISTNVNLAFDQLTSIQIYKTPVTSTSFIVPVTVGAPAYLIRSTNQLIAPILIVALGFFFQSSCRALIRKNTLTKSLIFSALIFGLRLFASNGGAAYLLINLTFSSALIIIFHHSYYFLNRFNKPQKHQFG